mmetsp:Transcript_18677/g.43552  ORF Transcript_18677/g.43552 Transcript_18677/m.43552 type:complete len:141 (-) Transcript_18677:133-555(-)
MPLYHGASLVRYIFYGSLADQVNTFVGVQLAYALGGYLIYFLAAAYNVRRQLKSPSAARIGSGSETASPSVKAIVSVDPLESSKMKDDSKDLEAGRSTTRSNASASESGLSSGSPSMLGSQEMKTARTVLPALHSKVASK